MSEEIKGSIVKNLNSVLLVVLTAMLAIQLNSTQEMKGDIKEIKTAQSTQAESIKVLQSEMLTAKSNDKEHDNKIYLLEVDKNNQLKDWIDQNYVRKSQR